MPPHTVLLIEDEEELREMMKEALERSGYAVVAAREGAEALELLQQVGKPCLVLLDLLMPGMNGWDFFAELKTRPEYAGVPVIVHSSAPSRAPLGATKVLQKPLMLDNLLAVVREYCSN